MEERKESLNFIEQIVAEDLETNKHASIMTRFPPEPNGYLHIGHTKAICINFGMTEKFGGVTNLRFDDTNPEKESTEYVNAIKRDIEWLGFNWGEKEYYTSDYFGQLYDFAVQLIKSGDAYIDESTSEEIAELKGNITKPGVNSPYRDRAVEENLDLFERMKNGEFDNGAKVLRAKVDMAHPNLLMRDPLIYRIKKVHHHRTGDAWNIYPMYDFAHGQSDSIESITHSLCSLEFENHRPLYNWFIEKLGIFPSRQIEFSRMNVTYMITSKRRLLKLVEAGVVSGWDDPRMPTVSGLRRKGYSPASIRTFCDKVGVTKREQMIDVGLLEECLRQDLNKTTDRIMAVLNPLKVIITNYPDGKVEDMEIVNNPEDETPTYRTVPFCKEIYIEQDDFKEVKPNRKYRRLAPGAIARLKSAYIIQCDDFIKDEVTGEIKEIHCTYFENSRSGNDVSGLKPKGTLGWVSAQHAVKAEARLYDRLFTDPTPDKHEADFMEFINKDSLNILPEIMVEPSVKDRKVGERLQFMRIGYFCIDPDSTKGNMIFNRAVTLRDTWAKIQKKG
ncbi:MAG: glutaminyl-tRNA synthetase [Maribacter sp.]|jgi:glutaminyl-tRNA synthetase